MAEVSAVKRSIPTFLLVLLIVFGGCTGRPDGVEPVHPFDIQHYKGEWFEIMRLDHSFERGLTNVTATYTLRDDGSVDVLNKGFDRKNCRWKDAAGRAVFQGDRDTASLSVTFFWPFAGGYHVFALDQHDYGWALISGPSRSYLWILARQPDLSVDIRNRLIDKARGLGFPVDELILVDHGSTTCVPGGSP
ncbi:lipocalin family protein [Dongia sp.]|uniref:lipocalin family protein n=1 Tax=Dongia sp. TaxID=1977262 RepID=UPI0034A3AB98